MLPGWFKPLHSKPQERRICAFDVEGRGGPGGFVCGSIVSEAGADFYLDPEAMFASLLDHGYRGEWLFAHNLEYDLPIVAGRKLLTGDLLFNQGGVLVARYQHRNHKVTFYDSTNLFPRQTVAQMGDLVGMPKLEVPHDQIVGMATSAAWGDLSPEEQAATRAYCTRDAEIVFRAVGLLQAEVLSLGGQLRSTIAGCAMDLYRRTFHKWPWRSLGPETNSISRPAFYGGRTEAFQLGKVEGVNLYDTNSLYPFVQGSARFPHPGHLQLLTDLQGIAALEGAEGVAEAVLVAPGAYLPTLPWRHDGRLFFPVGRLSGTWTLAEIRAALERGYQLEGIRWALFSRVLFNPFQDYVDQLWKRRQGYLAADDGRAAILKLLLNSLYGRFGLNPEDGLWRLFPSELDPGDGRYRGFVTREVAGLPVMFGPVRSTRQPAYVNVLIAAQVTAEGRLHLLEGLEQDPEAVAYCDTDSILTHADLPVSDDLGGWRLQMQLGSADLIGPKEYILHNLASQEIPHAKGVPEGVAAEYLRTGAARFMRAVGVREAIAQGTDPAEWVEVLKERQTCLPKRCPAFPFEPDASDLTLTVPWDAQELEQLGPAVLPYHYRPLHRPGLSPVSAPPPLSPEA